VALARIAAHINDAGITVLDGERIRFREPGFAYLDGNQLTTGNQAYQNARVNPRNIHHRFWSELSIEHLADRRFSHLSAADLVSSQLEHVQTCEGVGNNEMIVAVPSYLKSQNLGVFLGICGELNIPVVALVDAAVAATRREYRNAVPVHIDMSLHSASLARLSQPGHSQVERHEVLEGCGVFALYDVWINAVAAAFVEQSRFDPLHTAETEQMLLNRLGTWVTSASGRESVALEIEYRGASYRAEIEALRLVAAAGPIYELIASKLRALFRAEDTPALQVTDRVSRMPGLVDMLKARVGGEIYVLEPGATARGALSRLRDRQAADGGISLIRQLPWDQVAIETEVAEASGSHHGVPTHLLYGDTAYAIGNSPLFLGSEKDEGERVISLPTDMPGLSRRHCSLTRQNGQCILQDHSRYGTFLNGHRIDSSTVLHVGDTLRVGAPGFEFLLITTDESHG
jgi:hypothetical protein